MARSSNLPLRNEKGTKDMNKKELLDEAEHLNKLMLEDKYEESLDRFEKFSTEEKLAIVFLLISVHSLCFKQIENHVLLRF